MGFAGPFVMGIGFATIMVGAGIAWLGHDQKDPIKQSVSSVGILTVIIGGLVAAGGYAIC